MLKAKVMKKKLSLVTRSVKNFVRSAFFVMISIERTKLQAYNKKFPTYPWRKQKKRSADSAYNFFYATCKQALVAHLIASVLHTTVGYF